MNSNMENLFKQLNLDIFFWGGAFEVNVDIENLSTKELIFQQLDNFCVTQNFYPLGNQWNEIHFEKFNELLHDALQFSFGFTAHRIFDYAESNKYFKDLTKNINFDEVRYFTNSYDNPWRNSSYSSNSISEYTLDLAIVLVNRDKFLFTYFLFED